MTEPEVEPKVLHATCTVKPKPVEAVFAALSDPNKIRRWMGNGEHSDLFEFGCKFRVAVASEQ